MKSQRCANTLNSGGLPPHGGSGLKLDMVGDLADHIQSPSTRREWIEIIDKVGDAVKELSPSTRREWIEISRGLMISSSAGVSLHTEGVD